MILQIIVVPRDCVFVFQVSFISTVCDRLMCAATDLRAICVLTATLIVIMSAKYHNCMYHCVL